MKKIILVKASYNNMRIDRFLRNYLGKIPQGLIEKNLRNGKIKLNQKKVKSSQKVITDDKISFFNFNFEQNIKQSKTKFNPNKEIVKQNEDLIIENNEFGKSSQFEITITQENNKSYVRAISKNGNIEESELLLSKINESLS